MTDAGKAKAVTGQDRLEAIAERLAARNARVSACQEISVLALSGTDSHATLLENGRPVARWAIEDPNIERHIQAILGD